MNDPINPKHYKRDGIECIEAVKAALVDGFPDYLRGNVIKYLWRYKERNGVEDLRKAQWYLNRLIHETEAIAESVSENADLASNQPAVKRYRDPTQADLANVPIACEVRDAEGQDWTKAFLHDIDITNHARPYRFLAHKLNVNAGVYYAQCRIEVAE